MLPDKDKSSFTQYLLFLMRHQVPEKCNQLITSFSSHFSLSALFSMLWSQWQGLAWPVILVGSLVLFVSNFCHCFLMIFNLC